MIPEGVKIIGNYQFGSMSPSDPSKLALGFHSKDDAIAHAESMNRLRDNPGTLWNLDYWKSHPEIWEVF